MIESANQDHELVTAHQYTVEVPGSYPVKLQVPDLARHAVATPDGRRYVVATFDDHRLGRDFVTAIYPQQNGYLTLYRLVVFEKSSKTPEEALKLHVEAAQAIQRGRLDQFVKQHSRSQEH